MNPCGKVKKKQHMQSKPIKIAVHHIAPSFITVQANV